MRGSPALVALLVLAGCGLLPPAPAEVTELAPDLHLEAPDGPIVVLGRGQLAELSWEAVAYRSRNGDVCTYQVVDELGNGGGCGPVPADGAVFGPIGATPVANGWVIVDAVLSGDVRRVRIETDGEPFEADVVSLTAIGVEVTGFAIALADGREPTALVALDAGGSVLERFELLPLQPRPGAPGAVPTPASP